MRIKFAWFLLVALVATVAIAHDDEDDFADVDTESDSLATETLIQDKHVYVKPEANGHHYFVETFEEDIIGSKWIKSQAKKEDVEEEIAKYDGSWSIESSRDSVLEGDKGLVLKSKAKHHAISSRLVKPFHFSQDKPLVVQYEVKFQNVLECGGAYVKLLATDPKLTLVIFTFFCFKTSSLICFFMNRSNSMTKPASLSCLVLTSVAERASTISSCDSRTQRLVCTRSIMPKSQSCPMVYSPMARLIYIL